MMKAGHAPAFFVAGMTGHTLNPEILAGTKAVEQGVFRQTDDPHKHAS